MSKKVKKRHLNGMSSYAPKRRNYALWLSAAAAVLTVALGVVLFVGSGDDGIPTNFVPQVIGAPRVAVAQESFDYGDVKNGTTVETVFRVQNVGDETLRIIDDPQVQVVEGCCPPRAVVLSKNLRPGQETEIHLEFMMHDGMDGPHDFRVMLRTNDPLEPVKELKILSNWIP